MGEMNYKSDPPIGYIKSFEATTVFESTKFFPLLSLFLIRSFELARMTCIRKDGMLFPLRIACEIMWHHFSSDPLLTSVHHFINGVKNDILFLHINSQFVLKAPLVSWTCLQAALLIFRHVFPERPRNCVLLLPASFYLQIKITWL